ncbi:insect cuticle protein domain-containing protein [Phthorimaea operculella]|nr:insect cuticle protein domain-containing protein [Phthorimaea operculella]
MVSKIVCLFALVATVAAQLGHEHDSHHDHHTGYSSQSIHRHDGHAQKIEFQDKHGHKDYDYRAHPHYEYKYQVDDKHTHDIKSQHESRDGDHVKGYYELHEPHGSVRKVQYESDKKTGFQATVKHDTHHVYHKHH